MTRTIQPLTLTVHLFSVSCKCQTYKKNFELTHIKILSSKRALREVFTIIRGKNVYSKRRNPDNFNKLPSFDEKIKRKSEVHRQQQKRKTKSISFCGKQFIAGFATSLAAYSLFLVINQRCFCLTTWTLLLMIVQVDGALSPYNNQFASLSCIYLQVSKLPFYFDDLRIAPDGD